MSKRNALGWKSLKLSYWLADYRNELLPQERTEVASEVASNIMHEIGGLDEHQITLTGIIRETLCGTYFRSRKRRPALALPAARGKSTISATEVFATDFAAAPRIMHYLVEAQNVGDKDSMMKMGQWYFDSLHSTQAEANDRASLMCTPNYRMRVSAWAQIGHHEEYTHLNTKESL